MPLDIPYTTVDIRRRLDKGHAVLEAESGLKREAQKGLLRAGSAGCVSDGGTIYGECHRVAHARLMGVDKPIPDDRKLMFQAGESNEDLWEKTLGKGYDGIVLRGQEVRRETPGGTVLGSPDLVLANKNGTWTAVLELKLVSASYTALRRHLDGEPDSKHLVQAATYMWLSGLPGVLCYTSRTDFSVEFLRKKYGGVAKIHPFYRMFYLTFRNDRLHYRDEFSSDERPTVITGQGIESFYTRVASMGDTHDLGDRPTNDHVNGAPASWNRCDPKYCAFAESCDRHERDYYSWLDSATSASRTE